MIRINFRPKYKILERIMRKQSGFTLMEMIITVAIIGIIMAGVVPNMIGWRNNARLSQAARQVYSDLQGARSRAIKTNRTVQIVFDNAADTYSVNGTTRRLPGGIEMDSAVFNAQGDGTASFNNYGFGRDNQNADNGGQIVISLAGGSRSSTISVFPSGNIRID